jgi:zinc protease
MRAKLSRIFLAVFILPWLAIAASAIDIKEIKTPGGITVWLVQDKTIPLIAMDFSFKGGSTSDPLGKEGATNFLTGMLDEGAGPLDSAAFQAARDDLAIKLSFDAGFDSFEGSFQTLSVNKDKAFELLKYVITDPKFEQSAMDRVRQQFLLGLQGDAQDPEKIASKQWMEMALGKHAYSRPSQGTEATIMAMVPNDLNEVHKRLFLRSGLQISVVGDIDATTLAQKLDDVFGTLPDTPPPATPPLAVIANAPSQKIIDRDIPQSIIVFGHAGILRNDPDFFPAFVMTHILGGGGLGSWLSQEVREKRGLTYGVGAGLSPMDHAGLFIGSMGTRNEKAGEALMVIKEVLTKMATIGPSQEELDHAKTYLTGSYPLRFDSNGKIASQILGIQQQNLGLDYIQTRNAKVDAVTLEQVKAAAKRILTVDKLLVSIVGKPEGL